MSVFKTFKAVQTEVTVFFAPLSFRLQARLCSFSHLGAVLLCVPPPLAKHAGKHGALV